MAGGFTFRARPLEGVHPAPFTRLLNYFLRSLRNRHPNHASPAPTKPMVEGSGVEDNGPTSRDANSGICTRTSKPPWGSPCSTSFAVSLRLSPVFDEAVVVSNPLPKIAPELLPEKDALASVE